MNSGERDELLIKLYLINMRDNKKSINGIVVTSVSFDGYEYPSIPSGTLTNFSNLTDLSLKTLTDSMGVSKSSAFNKSDVSINNKAYSLKSFSAAPPAIVNHTSRPGWENIANNTSGNITKLDVLVDDYWALRLAGTIGEDIKNSSPISPFNSHKSILKPFLEYFLFVGSGSGPSKHKADYILDYSDPSNSKTWSILSPSQAVDQIWDKLFFSIRAKKGMPKNYTPSYKGKNATSIALWVNKSSGKYRGALHVRVGK